MACADYEALFIRPESKGWSLVTDLLGVSEYSALPLARVVQCPAALFALRDNAGLFVSVSGAQFTLTADSALPVRVWTLDSGAAMVLEAPCGPKDTRALGTFLTTKRAYVGSAFSHDALRDAGALWSPQEFRRAPPSKSA